MTKISNRPIDVSTEKENEFSNNIQKPPSGIRRLWKPTHNMNSWVSVDLFRKSEKNRSVVVPENPPIPLAEDELEKDSSTLILMKLLDKRVQDAIERAITELQARATLDGAQYITEIERTLTPQAIYDHHAKW